MARDTLANAKQELYAVFAATPGDGPKSLPVAPLVAVGMRVVFRGEPFEVPKPLSMSVATSSVTPTDWTFVVRTYATSDDDALAAQDRIDEALQAIDDLLAASDGFGPLNWSGPTWNEDLSAFVASSALVAGRQDYF